MAATSLPNTGDPHKDVSLLLNRLLRITILDERYFIGRFTCTDADLNIVLFDAEEFRPHPRTAEERDLQWYRDTFYPKSQRGSNEGEGWGRYAKARPIEETGMSENHPLRQGSGRMLGSILIPGKQVVTVELIEEDNTDASNHMII